jgi:hypothetical protein
MLRYQVFLSYGIAFASVWIFALQTKKEMALSKEMNVLVTFAPLLAVALLGVYLLLRLVLGVLAYEDCPDAAKVIEKQILEAKVEMKRRKIIS